MPDYYTGIVWRINIILLCLSVGICIIFIPYLALKRRMFRDRYSRLMSLITSLQDLAYDEKRLDVNKCLAVVRKASLFEYLDIARHKDHIVSSAFRENLHRCLNDPKRTGHVERLARRSLRKWTKIEALLTVGYLNTPNALSILTDSVLSGDDDVAYFSLIALGQIKNSSSARAIMSFLSKRPSSGYRVAPVLERFPEDIAEVLLESAGSREERVRYWSLRILSSFSLEGYAGRLARFTEDPSPDVRAVACDCLGRTGSPEAVERLKAMIREDLWFVKIHAIRALEGIQGPGCAGYAIGLLGERHWFVRENAKDILVRHAGAAAPRIKETIARSGGDIRKELKEVLERAGNKR
jgi:hypothetical protein